MIINSSENLLSYMYNFEFQIVHTKYLIWGGVLYIVHYKDIKDLTQELV